MEPQRRDRTATPAEDHPLLRGLDSSQRRAVVAPGRQLRIEAGAGSGKTRVLTRRVAYRVDDERLDPRHVLALTFTRKAAGELTSRLRALDLRETVTAGTFHALAYAQLRARWADRGIRPPALLDRKVGFVARLLPRDAGSVAPLEVVTEIEWAKARLVLPPQFATAAAAAGRRLTVAPELVAETFTRYEAEKRSRRLVDFDDLLRLCWKALTDDKEFAAAQHWRFRHVFVDEFQDVNPLQFELLRAWLGPNTDLCVVGDPHQAIYGWNGADARYLTDFGRYFPDASTVSLDQNYRSTPQILTVAGSVLTRRGTDPVLGPNRPDGDIPQVVQHVDDRDEARGVARRVRDLNAPGSPWSAQAVLVRTNAQTALMEEALRHAGIPCRVRGGGQLLQQPEVKSALGRLRASTTEFDAAITDLEQEAGPPPDATATSVDEQSAREGNIGALVRLAHEYRAIEVHPTGPGFVAWLSDVVGADRPDDHRDAVEIATFHAAKGLEWPVVHIAGVEQGLVPVGHAKTDEALDEERRLFYVAITRAQQRLTISWAAERTFGSRTVTRRPSLFLDDVERARAALRGEPAPDVRPARRSGRARVERPASTADLSPSEEQAFDALRTWRGTVARAAEVPAYVVFHDTTLRELARRRPSTADELLAISGVGPVKVNRYGSALLEVLGTTRAS